MKRLFYLALFIVTPVYASFPEMFGASATTSGIGNQFNDNESDPSNNYYNPALLGFSKRPTFQANTNYNKTKFSHINNVTTKNTITSETNETGNIDTDYPATFNNSYHISLPILREDGNKFAISIFSPATYFQEMSSGDAFQTEYVMYRARNERTTLHFNFIVPLENGWSYSLGAYSGMQIAGETEIVARYNNTAGKTSNAKMKAKAKPSLSPILSFAKRHNLGTLIVTYQHQMKNKMQIHSIGATRDAVINLPYDFTMDSMVYFDPATLRLGESWIIPKGKVFTTIEYQHWKGYKPSSISIQQNGGFIVSSGNYEDVRTRDIIVPKLGYEFAVNDQMKASMGLAYRPTPLKGNFSESGNSVDTDAYIYAIGMDYSLQVLKKKANLALSLQLYDLEDKRVTKSPNMENGAGGNKIGAPGYDIGGTITNVAMGLGVEF